MKISLEEKRDNASRSLRNAAIEFATELNAFQGGRGQSHLVTEKERDLYKAARRYARLGSGKPR